MCLEIYFLHQSVLASYTLDGTKIRKHQVDRVQEFPTNLQGILPHKKPSGAFLTKQYHHDD